MACKLVKDIKIQDVKIQDVKIQDVLDIKIQAVLDIKIQAVLDIKIQAVLDTVEPQSYGLHSYGKLGQPDTDIKYIFGKYLLYFYKWVINFSNAKLLLQYKPTSAS